MTFENARPARSERRSLTAAVNSAVAVSLVGASGWSVRATLTWNSSTWPSSRWRSVRSRRSDLASMSSPVMATVMALRQPPTKLPHTLIVDGGGIPFTPEIRTRSGPSLGQRDRVEQCGGIGVGVRRSADLVEELGGHRPDRHQPAGAGVFRDDARTVGEHLGDREPRVLEVRDLLEEGVVAAGALGAALDDVTGHDRAGQRVERVPAPPEPPGGGSHHHGGVGDPAGDDDVGPRIERGGDAESPEVGVGGHQLLARVGRRAPVSRWASGWPAARSRGRSRRMSSPSTWATWHDTPASVATSRSRAASPPGLRPPASTTTLIPRCTHVASDCCIWRRNVAAYPVDGSRWRAFHKMSIVSSAR